MMAVVYYVPPWVPYSLFILGGVLREQGQGAIRVGGEGEKAEYRWLLGCSLLGANGTELLRRMHLRGEDYLSIIFVIMCL